jgi:hypothetical protein
MVEGLTSLYTAAGLADSLTSLQTLAGGLCADAGIRLEPSDSGWYHVSGTGRIGVDLAELRAWGTGVAAGVIAHECGHALVTSLEGHAHCREIFAEEYKAFWLSFALSVPKEAEALIPALAARFHNAFEDGRIESFLVRRYPGCRDWLLASARALRGVELRGAPEWMQFELGLADLRSGVAGDGAGELAFSARVREALDAEWPVIDRVRASTPTAALDGLVLQQPDGVSRFEWLPRQEAIVAAHRLAVEASRSLMRAYLELFRPPNAPKGMSVGKLLAGDQPLLEALRDAAAAGPVDPRVRVVAEWELEGADGAEEKGADGAEMVPLHTAPPPLHEPEAEAPVAPPVSPPPDLPPPAAHPEVGPLAAALHRALADVFPKVVPGRRRSARPQGVRPNLPALLRLEADPRASLAVWDGPPPPKARRAAVLLLVDLSGSMRGAKADAAALAVEACGRAMSGLAIRVGVYGFQDVAFPVLPLGAHRPDALAEAGARIRGEVCGEWPGGNNCPCHNDDGPAVDAAARVLAACPERDRLLIVFSDGHPAAVGDAEGRLREAVARWGRPRSGVHLVGVGVGPGTTHVADFYPDGLANVAPRDLPRALARVLRQRLLTGAR